MALRHREGGDTTQIPAYSTRHSADVKGYRSMKIKFVVKDGEWTYWGFKRFVLGIDRCLHFIESCAILNFPRFPDERN